jgi:hypothetical protein
LVNITLFSIVRRGEGARGQVQYSRWLNLRLSATELLCFSALFLLLFLLGEGWFLLGGALGCGVTGARHWLWSRKAQRLANAQPVEE